MLKLAGILLFMFFTLTVYSQIHVSDAEIMVQTRHVWRGAKLGTEPAIEPSVTFSAMRFSLNFWASMTTNNSYSEIDLIPSYQFRHFKTTLFDYYNPVQKESNRFLEFGADKSRHSVELAFDNFSSEKPRLKWMIGTFLLGDKNEITGNAFFSTYFELNYPFWISVIELCPVVGITPFRGYYAQNFAVINTGISFKYKFDLKLPVKFPVGLSFISNPYTRNTFVTFAGGIAF